MTFRPLMRHDRITALWFIDRPTFSTSRSSGPDQRHGRHHGQPNANAVGRAIRAAGAPALLPAYIFARSKPIEQFFAKFKHCLRKAALRTSQAVYGATAPSLDTVSSTDCVADPCRMHLFSQ
jgi:hypothetical protein